MKRLFLLFTLLPIIAFSQSKKELENELKITKSKFDSLQNLFYQQQTTYQQRITNLEATIDKIKFVVGEINFDAQQNGTIGNGVSNSNFTNSFSNNVRSNKRDSVGNGLGDGLTPKTGATIYTGSRGGQYYINKNGNKTYIRRKN